MSGSAARWGQPFSVPLSGQEALGEIEALLNLGEAFLDVLEIVQPSPHFLQHVRVLLREPALAPGEHDAEPHSSRDNPGQ